MSGGTNTTTSTSGPPPQVLQNYQNLVGAATSVAGQPLQQYTGPMVAGFTPQQTSAFQTINNSQGMATPYLNTAAQEFGSATTPLWQTLPQMSQSQLASLSSSGMGGIAGAQNAAGQVSAIGEGIPSSLASSTNYASSLAQQIPGAVSPYVNAGTTYNVSPYLSPYTQNVTQTTQALLNQQNAQQLQQVQGNAAASGAYGGDREAVAQALTAQQQQLAEAPELANIEQQGFEQAQGEANTQQGLALQGGQLTLSSLEAAGQLALGAGQLGLSGQQAAAQDVLAGGQLGLGAGQAALGQYNTQQQQQLSAEEANAWLASQAGFGMAGLGTEAQQSALTGASAQLQAGGLQQQLAQEQLNIPYEQFTAAQQYPYQTLSFLSPIIEGTGSLSGGTSATTYPGPSTVSQLAGLGIAGLGAYGLYNSLGSTGGDYGGGGYYSARGGRVPHADGGRIGMQFGGVPGFVVGVPSVPSVGPGVPQISSPIPAPMATANATPSTMGLSVNQPQVTTTQSSNAGLLSDLSPLLGLANLALHLQRGGIVRRQDGGNASAATGPTTIQPLEVGTSQSGLPPIPHYQLDQIIQPGPMVKGEGPPRAPQTPHDQENPVTEGMSLLSASKGLKGIFGGNSDTSTSARGGHVHRQDGGNSMTGYAGELGMGSVPVQVAAQYGGAPPGYAQAYQQLAQLPLEKLQEMATMYPSATPQGQIVSRALALKRATPSAGTTQISPAGGITVPQTALNAPAAGPGGTASLARGGMARSFVTEDELDPLPVVDHSGDRIKVRYPSEKKVLLLRLPSIKGHEHHAAGGATGQVNFGAPTPSGVAGINLISAPNGIAIPQIAPNAIASPAPISPTSSGGLGQWFNPLATPYSAVGASMNGPGGSLSFPSQPAYTPGQAGIISAFGLGSVPTWAGGSGSTSAAPTSGSSTNAAAINNSPFSGVNIPNYGDARGGRVHRQSGGDAGDGLDFDPSSLALDLNAPAPSSLASPSSGPLSFASLLAAQSAIPASPPEGTDIRAQALQTQHASDQPFLQTIKNLAGYLTPSPDTARFNRFNRAPSSDQTLISGGALSGMPVGEPGAPAAMVTPDRGPPPYLGSAIPAPVTTPSPTPTMKPSAPADTSQPKPGGAPVLTAPQPSAATPQSTFAPNVPATSLTAPELPANPTDFDLTTHYESAGAAAQKGLSPFDIGYGGVDLSKAPLDSSGAPIWEGARGPNGQQTHAFGAAQFQPATWKAVVDQNFGGYLDWRNPSNQKAVFDVLHAQQGWAPWQSNQALMTAVNQGQGEAAPSRMAAAAGPMDFVGYTENQGSQQPGTEGTASGALQQYSDRIQKLLDSISGSPGTGQKLMSSPWLPLLAAGLGMMASRSPFPGVAIGEGGLAGVQALEAQQKEIPELQTERVRTAAAELPLLQEQFRMGLLGNQMARAQTVPSTGPAILAPGAGGMSASPATTGQATAAALPPAPTNTSYLPTGTAVPQAYGSYPAFDGEYQNIDQQKQQLLQQLGIYGREPNSAFATWSLIDPTGANNWMKNWNSMVQSNAKLLSDDPRYAAQKAGAVEAVQYPYKFREALAWRAAEPYAMRPNEPVVTGAQVMGMTLPEMGGNFTLGAQPTTAQPTAISASNVTPPPASALGQRQPAIAQGQVGPFVNPPLPAPDANLTRVAYGIERLPGGGVESVPTIPGLPAYQATAAKVAEKAMTDIPAMTDAQAQLDLQHQEIVANSGNDNFLQPGAGATGRINVATVGNTLSRLVGGPDIFDPAHLGDANAIAKQAFNLSAASVHQISARPAYLEFQGARGSVPSNDLTPFSALLVSNTLRYMNQFKLGQAQFIQGAYENRANPSEAAVAYQQQNGSRVAGSALAQTWIDLARVRGSSEPSEAGKVNYAAINYIIAHPTPANITLFDQHFHPLDDDKQPIDPRVMGVRSWGTLITQLAQQPG